MTRLASLIRRMGMPPPRPETPARGLTSSEFEINCWAVSEFVSTKLVPVVGIHPFPLHELMLMVAVVCRFEPPQIFEWGTHIGKSARIFHESTRYYGIATEIHSTDLPDEASHVEHPHRERGRLVRGLGSVHLHLGDGLDTSLALWRDGGRRPGPLFFVDGDHAYESVHHELVGITQSVPDAVILVHDTFYQSQESGYNVGPHRAIGEVLGEPSGRYRRLDSGLGLPGMTLLYPVPSDVGTVRPDELGAHSLKKPPQASAL